MPTATYEELLIRTLPQVIETEQQYRQIARRFGDLVGKGRARSAEETKLLRLLALLVEDYDRRHALPPDKSTPAEKLQFLLEHSGKTATDLQSVFGQRSHVHEAPGSEASVRRKRENWGNSFASAPDCFIHSVPAEFNGPQDCHRCARQRTVACAQIAR